MSSRNKQLVINVIAAVSNNGIIGIDNKLPWNIPADLKRFKELTMGHHILMGRKTYESIGRPLPGRTSVIITSNVDYKADGCLIATSIEEALAISSKESEVFFIGGANIYSQIISDADNLHITEIQASFIGDAYFPQIDPSIWQENDRIVNKMAGYVDYHFITYKRINSK